MTRERKETGANGELLAAEHLRRAGYRIIARNYRCPLGELDIVAEDGDAVVFIEVKTRRVPWLARPEENVNRAKAERLMRSAEHFLTATGRENWPWRVDVVAVEVDSAGRLVHLTHFQDALSDVLRRP